MTIERFEESRLAKIIEGVVIVYNWLKPKPVDNLEFYIKNIADFERLQRDLERRHAIYYTGA